MFTPIKYQSLAWRTTIEEDVDCGNCATGEVYMDWTQPFEQVIQTEPFNGYNLLDYTYDGGDPMFPVPDVKTPTLVRLADLSGMYCYDRTGGDPYWCSYTLPLVRRSAGVGDVAIYDYLKMEFTYTSNVVMYATLQIQGPLGQSASTAIYVELPVQLVEATVTKYIRVTVDYASFQLLMKFNASTIDSDAEFCISDVSLMQMSSVTAVAIIDCYGDTDAFSGTDIAYYEDKILLTFEFYEGYNLSYFRVLGGLNPSESTSFDQSPILYSNWFLPINPETYGDCKLNSLMKVEWTQPCMYVADGVQTSIDYEFYLKGYAQRITSELRERVLFIDSNAIGLNAFQNTVGKAEIVVNYPYRWWVHEILEGITSNNTFYINDQQYRPDASNIWTTAGNGNGTYSGRIEMCVAGTERIQSICCCPVAAPDYSGCGDLTIRGICVLAFLRTIRYELSGAVNATSIDVQFENLTAIEDSPCNVDANTTHTESAVTAIGFNAVTFTPTGWSDIFDNNYCGVDNIEFYIRIRTNCGDGNVGEWSEPFTIVPANLDTCA